MYKNSEKVEWGGDGVDAAPPQKHSNFKDPTEAIYLQKKHINRNIKDRESDFRAKHASGAFVPGADPSAPSGASIAGP